MKFKIEKDNELDSYSVRVCLPFEGWVWLGEVATYSLAQSLVKIYNEKSKKKTGEKIRKYISYKYRLWFYG